jgi:hypothetical protein
VLSLLSLLNLFRPQFPQKNSSQRRTPKTRGALMQTETEPTAAALPASDYKPGFMSRRRRLRNRWNIHMRKDERAQAKAWNQSAPDAVALGSTVAVAVVPPVLKP